MSTNCTRGILLDGRERFREANSGKCKYILSLKTAPRRRFSGKTATVGKRTQENSNSTFKRSPRDIVMMVSDDVLRSQLFRAFLARDGLKVEVFINPFEAFIWHSTTYQAIGLILIDLQIPELDLFDYFENIILSDPLAKVAFLSSASDMTLKNKLQRSPQVYGIFKKPINYYQLATWCRQLFTKDGYTNEPI